MLNGSIPLASLPYRPFVWSWGAPDERRIHGANFAAMKVARRRPRTASIARRAMTGRSILMGEAVATGEGQRLSANAPTVRKMFTTDIYQISGKADRELKRPTPREIRRWSRGRSTNGSGFCKCSGKPLPRQRKVASLFGEQRFEPRPNVCDPGDPKQVADHSGSIV